MKIWLNQLLCHHLWDKRCHWYRGDSTVYKKCRFCGKVKRRQKDGINVQDYIICECCGIKKQKSEAEQCECGANYCGFSCLVKGLHEVGVRQYTFDELDRCGKCAVEKLKAGKLIFPQGDKRLNRLLDPSLLLYVIGETKPVKRKKKVSENQLSLFQEEKK